MAIMNKIHLVNHSVSFIDYPNPNVWSTIYFFTGCSHNCKSCQNKDLQNYNQGIEYNVDDFFELIKENCEKNHSKYVVLSGGDPLYFKNIEFTKEILLKCKENSINVCVYTGFDIEYVKNNNVKGFQFIKCGTFDENNKLKSGMTDEYFQLASPNQNFYNDKYEQLSENGKMMFERNEND